MTCVCTHAMARVWLRRPLSWVDSLLPLWVPGVGLRDSNLETSFLNLLSHLANSLHQAAASNLLCSQGEAYLNFRSSFYLPCAGITGAGYPASFVQWWESNSGLPGGGAATPPVKLHPSAQKPPFHKHFLPTTLSLKHKVWTTYSCNGKKKKNSVNNWNIKQKLKVRSLHWHIYFNLKMVGWPTWCVFGYM